MSALLLTTTSQHTTYYFFLFTTNPPLFHFLLSTPLVLGTFLPEPPLLLPLPLFGGRPPRRPISHASRKRRVFDPADLGGKNTCGARNTRILVLLSRLRSLGGLGSMARRESFLWVGLVDESVASDLWRPLVAGASAFNEADCGARVGGAAERMESGRSVG